MLNLEAILCCICVGCFVIFTLCGVITFIDSVVDNRRRRKREDEQALREKEYHAQRMKDIF